MADRRLVVTDTDSASTDYGKLFALDASSAHGVAIPTFRVEQTLPPSGTEKGESVYELTSRRGWVWDGTSWKAIAPSPMLTFADETVMRADTTSPVSTYAITQDTGSLFVRRTAGWALVGIKEYGTVATLLADNPPVGVIGFALDESTQWLMTPTGWAVDGLRRFNTTADLLAWVNPPGTVAPANPQGVHIGDRALDVAHGVLYVRLAAGWAPVSIWEATEANIRAASWAISGQTAISTDTGRTFTRQGSTWIEEPIQHYATEAGLLAATPPNGVLAWADDTNVAYLRAAGMWKRLQGPQITVGGTQPAAASAAGGDQWFDGTATSGPQLYVHDATKWVPAVNPGDLWAVGSIQQSMLTEAQFNTAMGATAAGRWVLADGRSVAGSKYAALTGHDKVPDMRGGFFRAAGQNGSGAAPWNGGAVGSRHDYTTGAPKTPLTGLTNTNGDHKHEQGYSRPTAPTSNTGIGLRTPTAQWQSNTGRNQLPRLALHQHRWRTRPHASRSTPAATLKLRHRISAWPPTSK